MRMTLKKLLEQAANNSSEKVALRFFRNGAWQERTFGELQKRAKVVAELLHQKGVKLGDRVAILRENSPEWYELYHGIVGLGAVAVPMDSKLREMEMEHILHDSGATHLFCSPRHLELLDPEKKSRCAIVLDAGNQNLPSGFHAYETLFDAAEEAAASSDRAYDQTDPAPDDPASILYTSGTTGRPKGAVLSHHNFLANVEGIAQVIHVRPTDNFFLVLPLHHSFAFTTMLVLPTYAQCEVSLARGIKTIAPDMAITAPTAFLAVPLLLEKMLARIQSNLQSKPLPRLLCRMGLQRWVGKKVHQQLGGKLRLIISGGAPISPASLLGWQRLGFRIAEGYGITETAPVLTFNPPDAPRVGTVGKPIPGVEIKIDAPNDEGVGEIIARGENVMQGYYNRPEETAQVLRDGWYHTGDMGRFDEKEYLVISGRKKSLIVNREGKNIYPEEVECQALQSALVSDCLALGYRAPGEESGERVGLLVVPNMEWFEQEEHRTGVRLSDEKIAQRVRDDLQKHLAALSNYKRPRKIQVRFEEFEKTPTQKTKRHLYAIDTSC
jgi:long-chain acyl-CoA synthetase